MYSYQLFASSAEWIDSLLKDIALAKRYIYVEMYRIHNDNLGHRICKALADKAKQGVQVKVLVDSWGSSQFNSGFKEITNNGGWVGFFKHIVITLHWFSKNHERNHRKIICIDDEISYLGSANIAEYSLDWRESILRIEGQICKTFKKLIEENIKINLAKIRLPKYYKRLIKDGFTIIREKPSIQFQKTRSFYTSLIKKAKKEITIITPYFLPGVFIRKSLYKASNQGINVKIIIPLHSDVNSADYIRDLYLGYFQKKGIHLYFYTPTNIHAKILLIDNKLYTLGSSNFDYRSFRYMYELTIGGAQKEIINLLNGYIVDTLKDCQVLDVKKTLKKPWYINLYSIILLPFRRLL